MPRKRVLFLLAIVACLAASVAAQRQENFEEKLFVREVELVFELDLTLLRALTFGPESLVVVEDGQFRPVTKVGSIEDAPWSAVVWVDEALADPETVFLATVALAERSAALTRIGSVEVVTARPGPGIETVATREPERVKQVLADLAGRARVERDRAAARPAGRSGASSRPDAATLRRQLDRLLVHLSGRREPGPRVLFLVADGFAVTPRESKAFEAGTADADAGRTTVIQDAARLLAAYGWMTVVLPFRKEAELGREQHGYADIDVFRGNHSTWGSKSSSVPPMIPPKARRDSTLRWEGVLRALTEPDLSPLRALMEPTAGMLVPQGEVLPAALEKLGERWHLYYQTQMPVDGRVRSVEVRWRDGSTPLRARRWIRSSTPEGIAEARLRRLLESDRLPESLPLQAELSSGSLKLTVAPFSAPDPVIPGPVRISLAYAGPDGTVQIRHETAPGIEEPGKGWSHTLPSAAPLAILVEDLARERWRAVRLDVLTPVEKS